MSNKSFTSFKKSVDNLFKRTDTLQKNIQEFLEVAFNHVAEHDDTTYLTYLVNSAIKRRGINTSHLMAYIRAHISNVRWSKHKDGKYGYTKIKKGVPYEMEDLTESWFDWVDPNTNETVRPVYTAEKFRASIMRAATRVAKESGLNPAQIADELAHISADLQSGELEIKLKAA